MERDYSIKLGDLKKKLRYLKSIYDGSSLLKNDILGLTILIERIKSNFNVPFIKETNDEYFEEIVEDFNGINRSIDLISVLEKLDLQSIGNPFLNISPSYTTLLLSDGEAVDLAYDFYQTQANIFFSNFLDVYDSLPNHLQFIKPNSNTNGEMSRLKSTRESYIFVPNNPNITKATILIHELQHAIDGIENDKFVDNIMVKEATAMFMEMIAADYISGRFKIPRDGTMRRAEQHSIVLTDSLYLLDKYEMFKSLDGEHITGLEEFYEKLYKKDYDDDEIETCLRYSTDSLVSYQLPHLLAIELYYMYKEDKEDTLEYLLGIVNYCTDDNIMSVLEGCEIKLGEHYYKYQKALEKQLKRSN
jgi:hypothetical protein